ncbi:MAG: xanthine dehydrogenase family protein molybdopterin-binding subunit [Spirochaetales bacterium]|nr:xanthine dehydrogenase family protein molybdopterin-binding subunit [Spirochaetales bacterium]
MSKNTKVVGHDAVRIDMEEKITGAALYTDDLPFGPNLLHMSVLASPHAHAEILNIDTSEAEKFPGVMAVATGKDYPQKFGLYLQDKSILPVDRVRYVGEQVAVVIARTKEIADEGCKLIKVDYKILEPILDVRDALKEDAVLIHPDLGDYQVIPWINPQPGTNISHIRKIRKGDVEKGFEEADFILEDEYHVPHVVHACIETHISVARYDYTKRLTMWNSTQSPHTQRHIMANALGIPHKDIRIIAPYVGGGFGGKAGISMEALTVACQKVPGYPVKLRWSRKEEFLNSSQRQELRATVKMGVTKEGKITALRHIMHWDVGASAEYGNNVVNATGFSATGPYYIPNVSIDSVGVYTNHPPCAAYRGFGYSEFHFGIESHMDRIAKAIGIDPVEFRRINAIKTDDEVAYKCHMNPSGMLECIDKVAQAIEWGKEEVSDDPDIVIAKGFASAWKAPAMPPNAGSSVFIKFSEDGSINVLVSGMEIGQGLHTAVAKFASEILTVPLNKIRVELPDTDRNPYEWQTVASHETWELGNATIRAARDARAKIFDVVSRAFHLEKESLYLEDGKVKDDLDPDFALPFEDFVITGIQTEFNTWVGGPIMGIGSFIPEFTNAMVDPDTGMGGHPNVHYTVGAGAVKIELNKKTGVVRVVKMAEGFDCGKAINPDLVKDQIVGGFIQGLGTALYEVCIFDDKGKMLNTNFTDYKIPTILEMPDEMIPIIVEVPQPDGPFGARGMSEHTMIPVMPAVANAIANAIGLRIKDIPLTAEKVALRPLQKDFVAEK